MVPEAHEVEKAIEEVKEANPEFGVRRCSIKDADTPGDCAAGASRNALESPAAGKIKQQGGTSKVSPSLADAFKQYSDEGGSSFSFGFGFGEPRELVVGATPYPESASTQPHSWLDLDGDCGAQDPAAEDEASTRDRPRDSRESDEEWETDEEEWERRDDAGRTGAGSVVLCICGAMRCRVMFLTWRAPPRLVDGGEEESDQRQGQGQEEALWHRSYALSAYAPATACPVLTWRIAGESERSSRGAPYAGCSS
eukprot:252788-Rhodomonas_salina.2